MTSGVADLLEYDFCAVLLKFGLAGGVVSPLEMLLAARKQVMANNSSRWRK
jgi:hypothetical protein